MPTETNPEMLATAERAFVIAPAGFGKTELIARAIEIARGRSLVLTHTHSGVNALRSRLSRLGVPRKAYDVATIAGWGLRYSSAYPRLSQLTTTLPAGGDWSIVYDSSAELLKRKAIRDVLRHSYSGVYVDEYQDCNLRQHEIVMALADVLPCRLLGDPLQGIFDFAEPTVDWMTQIAPNFERLPDLQTPHRWLNTNPQLGQWIAELRARLLAGEPLDLESAPVSWRPVSEANQRTACYEAIRDNGATVVAISKWPRESHDFASRMSGLFTAMEEMDCRALMEFGTQWDSANSGHERSIHLIDLASRCFTRISGELARFRDVYESGQLVRTGRLTTNRRIAEALNTLAEEGGLRELINAARAIESYPGASLYRRELWQEIKTTVLTMQSRPDRSLSETAWYVRDRSRRNGRRPENRIASRTLLVKGLEFDKAVVLDSGPLSPKEFYVAATRGTSGLWLLSSKPTLRFAVPDNILGSY